MAKVKTNKATIKSVKIIGKSGIQSKCKGKNERAKTCNSYQLTITAHVRQNNLGRKTAKSFRYQTDKICNAAEALRRLSDWEACNGHEKAKSKANKQTKCRVSSKHSYVSSKNDAKAAVIIKRSVKKMSERTRKWTTRDGSKFSVKCVGRSTKLTSKTGERKTTARRGLPARSADKSLSKSSNRYSEKSGSKSEKGISARKTAMPKRSVVKSGMKLVSSKSVKGKTTKMDRSRSARR